jgi:dihydroneopterin aldolase
MESIVFIDDLNLETYIGLHDWEKDQRQIVVANISLGVNIAQAANLDDVSLSVDYEKLSNHLREWALNNRVELLEKFALQIVDEIKTKFNNITSIELRLTKKGVVPNTSGCGVQIKVSI